jgi:hypothetical protein
MAAPPAEMMGSQEPKYQYAAAPYTNEAAGTGTGYENGNVNGYYAQPKELDSAPEVFEMPGAYAGGYEAMQPQHGVPTGGQHEPPGHSGGHYGP